ncbi:cation-transporting ATPase E [Bacilli bacterium PM5-3]|nr:cation-transporting ATPase E [Bacilli bacterium PM5-3]MDH6603593.1 cation-transporting ATPase E [Bacilli bacterium PM5-9]
MNKQDVFKMGLTRQEVIKRVSQNLVNDYDDNYTKSTLNIFKDNIVTPFNIIIAFIGCALALVGAYINMLFIFIIVLNIAVGIIQELIAKSLVEKLSLLNVDKCTVIRDGKELIIDSNKIVVDDLLIIDANHQIICDGIVVAGEAEINEALLSGEYDPIIKKESDQVLSGSYVISGKIYVKVEHVGEENYAIKISKEAKKHKKISSVLMGSMNKILKIITIFILPAGLLLFIRSLYVEPRTLYDAVVSTSASIIGMLPIGVVLLITASLATGVIRLSKMKVLVQELHALESLSRVDLICLDKTGTLTEGVMSVEGLKIINREYDDNKIKNIMQSILGVSKENNATFKAMERYFDKKNDIDVYAITSFSSQRKWSSVSFNENETFYLGAPDVLVNDLKIDEYLKDSKRVILLASAKGVNKDSELLKNIEPIALISLDDPIRKEVKETMEYFKKQDVDIKVISGDNPITVSKIAQDSGIDNYDKYLDLSKISDDDLILNAKNYTIFGRANPNQKKLLIEEFKKTNTVAMTGDGVNDVLALKEADCSIAVAQGSDAAKSVSQLVLIESDFNDLPNVVNEGRRVVNNITKVASVYFVKTIYSALLTVLAILIGSAYPFTPIQVTLINFALVGIPTFAITFESNDEPISGDFISKTLGRAIPNALAIIIMICMIKMLVVMNLINLSSQQTLLYLIVASITLLTVYQISKPLNNFRKFLLSFSIVTFAVSLYTFKDIIDLQIPGVLDIILFIFVLIFGVYLIEPLHKVANYLIKKINKFLNK